MATSAGEIEIALSLAGEGFKKSLGEVEGKLDGFQKGVKTLGVTLAGVFSAKAIVDFGKQAFQAFAEQEAAVVKLNQAMANFGIYSEEASKDLQDYAAALQETTVYADEQITSMQAQLVAFGLQGDQLKQVTKATLDLASAKGIDLTAAANLLGKAFVGETGSLSRYGIVIDDAIPKNEKFAAVLGKVNGMFGGQAEKERQTAIGQLKGMQNTYSELMETIGSLIAGPATALMKWLSDIIRNVNSAIQILVTAKNEAGGFANFLAQTFILALTAIMQTAVEMFRIIEQALLKYITLIPGLSNSLKLIGVDLQQVSTTLNTAFAAADTWIADQGVKLQGLTNKWLNTGTKAVAVEKAKGEAVIEFNNVSTAATAQRMVTEAEMEAAMYAGFMANQEARLTALNDFLGLSASAWTDFHKIMQNLTQQTFDQFGQAMADVIVDSKSFSDALKGIWKSLIKTLIAEIVTLIAKLIVALALKSALGLGGASVGAAASNISALTKIAGKAANGAMINEPSLVTGLKSGKTILAGEAGAEAIVPMGRGGSGVNKTATEMGTSFAGAMDGGGGVTLNVSISGQFLEADESVWQRMFRDKILPEIRRATMSNPTGNFIRRRGATT